MTISSVMLSHRPTVDRIAAFDLVQQVVGRPLDILFANQTDNLSNAEVKALGDEGIVLIGVGKGRTYRERQIDGRKFGSETELLLNDLLTTVLPHSRSRVLGDFAAMMSRNNEDGYLVRQPYSVNQIIRDAYRLGHDPEEIAFTFSDEEVVRRGAHVVRMYLNAREKGGLDLGARERIKRMPAVELLPEWARQQNGPLTVGRYMRDMCMLEVTEEELRERALWFIRINDRAAKKEEEAEKRVDAGDFNTFFEISGYGMQGIWVKSDDPYLLKVLAGRRHLVAMRSHLGNVIIVSKTFNLAKVGVALQAQEPGHWHVESGKRNVVANGTESVPMSKTGLSQTVLGYVIGANVVRKVPNK